MNPLEFPTKAVNEYFISFQQMYPQAYDKSTTNPYTKTRVILMNGTEYESVWFLHQFARHCDQTEIKEALALVRKQEQQQQKMIACLKPLDESILETTLSYEQLAIDLTATLAQTDVNKTNIEALNFALLEDFDHLYRYSNLMLLDIPNADPAQAVGKFTEIMPGRPTLAHHRFPKDDLRKAMNASKNDIFSKLVVNIITAAEQQTMNYYMNIAQWYKNDLGRQLYAEIGMIEEQHVTQYESLKDPTCTWLEQWVLHEYTEAYLYYSMAAQEVVPHIKAIWENFFEMECAHLKLACNLLEKYEKTLPSKVVGSGEFPHLLQLGTNKEYVRNVLERTVMLTSHRQHYIDVMNLPTNADFFQYQERVITNVNTMPSHVVVAEAIEKLGQDYRYQDKPHPVKALQNRKKDNTELARSCTKIK